MRADRRVFRSLIAGGLIAVCVGSSPSQDARSEGERPGPLTATWDSLFSQWLARVKHADREALAVDYFKIFYPNEWEAMKNDEFRRDTRASELKLEMDRQMRSVRPDQVYDATLEFRVAPYDFSRRGFPLEKVEGGRSEYILELRSNRPRGANVPDSFTLHIEDMPAIMPMDETAARGWVALRKETSGNIDRRIILKLTFAVDFVSDVRNVYCHLLSATAYDCVRPEEVRAEKVLIYMRPRRKK